MKRIAAATPTLALIFYCTSSASAAEPLKHLDAAAIRSTVVGHVITDESHWSDRYATDGTLDAMELGQHKKGSWKLKANEMCVTRQSRKPLEECFEIWLSKNGDVEYRRDGIVLTTAVLRKE